MYLCIYNKDKKLYFATVKRLTDKSAFTNPEFKTVVVGYNNKIRSFPFNSEKDLIRIYPELKSDYAGRLFVVENRYKDKVQIKLVVCILNNPLWLKVLDDKDIASDIEEGKCATKTIEINSIDDVKLAEKEFDFSNEFLYSFV